MFGQYWHLLSLLLWSQHVFTGGTLQANAKYQPLNRKEQFHKPSSHGMQMPEDQSSLVLIQTNTVVTPLSKQNANLAGVPQLFDKPQTWADVIVGSAMTHPLSMATWCTMVLITLTLVVFIAWSFAHNYDELAGRGKPSQVTDVLITASRSLSYPPVFCSIFVASQMHRIALITSDNGVEATAFSSAVCMLIASFGIVLQFFVVFVVPFFVTIPEGQMLSKIAFTSHCDVHAVFANLATVVKSTLPFVLLWCGRVAMLSMYVGMLGVVGTLFANGLTTQSEFLSTPLYCVVILGVMYLAVHLCLWWTSDTQAVKDTRPWKVGPHEDRIRLLPKGSVYHSLSLSAAMTMRRAPMIAILFLSDRLHTLDILGWQGSSPSFLDPMFGFTTASFLVEALLAAFAGAWGKEETGYSDVHIFTSSWQLHFAQFCFSCFTHAGLFYNLYLLIFYTHGAGDLLPTSIIVIIGLSCFFFVCYFCQAVAFFLKNVCGLNFKVLQDTTIAACTSVAVCPMVSILFVATRLRAVQITDRNGSSQLWAQTAMYLIAFAIVVQAACCLFLPLFSGNKFQEEDADQEEEQLQPLLGLGAYVVIGVRYFALICIVAGAIAVCISIYTITPDTATYGSYVGHFELLQSLCAAAIALLLAMCLSSAKVVGLAIKVAVERAAENAGIEVSVARAALSVCDGWIHIKDVTVYNLQKPGLEFKSPYLIKMHKVVLQLDMWKLMTSWGKTVIIYKVEVFGVDILVEKHSFSEMSNLQVLARHLDKTQASDRGCPAPFGFMDPVCRPCAQKVRLEGARLQNRLEKVKKLQNPSFATLHDVSISGLQAAIWKDGRAVLDVPLKDVAINKQGKDHAPFEIIEILVIEVLRKVSQSREFRKRLIRLMGERLANNVASCFPGKRRENEAAGSSGSAVEDGKLRSAPTSDDEDKH